MDFELTEEQVALGDLAKQILTERCTKEYLDKLDASDEWFDRATWSELVDAGLLGIALPESVGGGGYSFLELHFVLEQIGATAAHLPVWETIVLGALPICTFGTPDQVERYVAPVAAGTSRLTAAWTEDGRDYPLTPATTAARVDGGYRLTGTKTAVSIAEQADAIIVAASTPDGAAVFLVDPTSDGVTITPQSTSTHKPHGHIELLDAFVADADVLAGPDRGAEALQWIVQHGTAAVASMQAGACQTALRMSAEYTSEREQFGVKIATFQAVGQRVADAYIDTEAIRLTALQAAWRLSAGLDATDAVDIAKFWAADGAHRVLHAAQHVHGGVGIDHDYPLHRFFRITTEMQFTLGSAIDHLRAYGQRLAEQSA